jgi:predicted nucleic acid-binding protein
VVVAVAPNRMSESTDEPRASNEPATIFEAVVLDANVLYPNSLRDLLLRLAEQGFYLPRWSAQILDEVRHRLIEDKRSDEVRVDRLLVQMRRHFLNAEVNPPQELIERMTNAVEDRHVLASAVEAGAELIVTKNLRDFPASALVPLGVQDLSPDDFLGEQLDIAPEAILETLREQAADLVNPPKTLDDVLSALDTQAPFFVARIRAMIARV